MAKKKSKKAPEEQDQHQQHQQQQESDNNHVNNNPAEQPAWYWSRQDEEEEQRQQQQEKSKPVAVDDVGWGDFGKAKEEGLFEFGNNNDKGLDWATPINALAATNLVDDFDNGVSIDDDKETKAALDHGASVPWDIPKKKPP